MNLISNGTQFDRTDDIASPRASLVYKPTRDLSVYVAYGTSYDPSAENLSLSARTADLGPEKDRTYEAGVKATRLGERLALSASVFDTEMTNARVGDPTNPTLQILAGDLRVRGLELNAQGYIAPGWEILAGYTYLDAKTIRSTDPTQVGQRVPNTAPNQANFWLIWEPNQRLLGKVGSRCAELPRHVAPPTSSGRRSPSRGATRVTVDAMASYRSQPPADPAAQRLQPRQQILLHQRLLVLDGRKPRGPRTRPHRAALTAV